MDPTEKKSLEMTKLAIIFQAGATPYLIMTETQIVPGTRQMTLFDEFLTYHVEIINSTKTPTN